MSENLASLLALARQGLSHFDIESDARVDLINLSENATYRIAPRAGPCFALRVHREGYHSRMAIDSELAWMMALRDAGVAITPRPVLGRDGAYIQDVYSAALMAGRQVVLFAWEDGRQPLMSDALEKPFEALGEVAARMHIHSRSWVRPERFQRFTWNFETSLGEAQPHWGQWRDGLGMDVPRIKLFGRAVDLIKQRLMAYGKGADRFGLVHGDLRLANVLIDGSNVKVIDFDDCGFSWFMYDAATTVSFYEDDAKVPGLMESWKSGYRRFAHLSIEDENEISTFIMLRRLLLVAWIGSHRETELAQAMGLDYTQGTAALCEKYLSAFSK